MGSYPDEFPFGIMEVVNLLNLRIRRQQANSVYVDCPFCGDRRGRMNVNFVKNVWRCNYCDAHGGMLALYAELNHTTTSDAYWEIAEALCDNIIIRNIIPVLPYLKATAPHARPATAARVTANRFRQDFSMPEPMRIPHRSTAAPAIRSTKPILRKTGTSGQQQL